MTITRIALLLAALTWLTPVTARQPVSQRPMAVSAAHPLAVEAGMETLKRGGDAVDAAIAVQAMLSLVEPQSSGLGGGAFLVRYDAATRRISVYDGRETAPATVTPGIFLDPAGKPLPRGDAMVSGHATGVPGVVAMLSLAHQEYGRLPWASLFESTAQRADAGFQVSARMARFIHGNYPQNGTADVRAYFSRPDGQLIGAGETLRNPAYADFVRKLAREGSKAFYEGETAAAIVAKTSQNPMPGGLTVQDIAAYQPVKRDAICQTYRVYLLCTAPPPASGVGLLQLMAILERTDIAKRGPDDPVAWFLFAQANRIMYADRDAWIGDPDFVDVPVAGLLDKRYVSQRAALIGTQAGSPPSAGSPPRAHITGVDATQEPGGTSHFVISDSRGNVVSMTTTVESFFGSGRMVDGFFPQQSDDRFLVHAQRPQCHCAGQAPAFVHVASSDC